MNDQSRANRPGDLARLRRLLEWPEKAPMRETLLRRIYSIEFDVEFANPFGDVDETLFEIWRR